MPSSIWNTKVEITPDERGGMMFLLQKRINELNKGIVNPIYSSELISSMKESLKLANSVYMKVSKKELIYNKDDGTWNAKIELTPYEVGTMMFLLQNSIEKYRNKLNKKFFSKGLVKNMKENLAIDTAIYLKVIEKEELDF